MKRFISFILSICLIIGLSGCGETVIEDPVILDYEHITWQSNGVRTLTENQLSDDAFYIRHETESGYVYYPLSFPKAEQGNIYYISGDEVDIPTLFLTQGDSLIYHARRNILQNITFTRIYDMGYTIGIYNISSIENGRCVLQLSNGSDHILSVCTDVAVLSDIDAEMILVDEFGEVIPTGYIYAEQEEGVYTFKVVDDKVLFYNGFNEVAYRNLSDYDHSELTEGMYSEDYLSYRFCTRDNLKSGILWDLNKDSEYHVVFYAGTYFGTFNMRSNIHIFKPDENFFTYDYTPLQSKTFEIALLNEMDSGYYMLGQGIFRLVREEDYSINDKFDNHFFPNGVSGTFSYASGHNSIQITGEFTQLSDLLSGKLIANNGCFEFTSELKDKKLTFSVGTLKYFNDKDALTVERLSKEGIKGYVVTDDKVYVFCDTDTDIELPDGYTVYKGDFLYYRKMSEQTEDNPATYGLFFTPSDNDVSVIFINRSLN